MCVRQVKDGSWLSSAEVATVDLEAAEDEFADDAFLEEYR